jgi:hypothetical protein
MMSLDIPLRHRIPDFLLQKKAVAFCLVLIFVLCVPSALVAQDAPQPEVISLDD